MYVAGFDHRAGMVRELKRIFSQYGTVLDVTQLTPQEGKKGVAFVKFARYSDAIAAVENVKHIRKQELTVKIASQTARKATNWQRQAKYVCARNKLSTTSGRWFLCGRAC